MAHAGARRSGRKIGRVSALLVIGVLIGALVPLSAGAAAAPWAPEAPAYGSSYIQKDVAITMSDGQRLRANIGIPTPLNATTPAAGAKFPVLLSQTPYRKDGGLFTVDPYFVGRGFVSMVVDVRGTGSSDGQWSSFAPREQQDGPEIISWITHQSWYDSSKGIVTLGASYLVINQLLTMEQTGSFHDPLAGNAVVQDAAVLRNVKAIFPVVPMSDSYRDVTFHGGNLDDAFMVPWLGLVTALGAPPADQLSNGNPSDTQDAINVFYQHATGAEQFQVATAASALTGGASTYDGQFSWDRSPLRNIDRVTVPTFMVGGEFDIFQRGEPLLYQALKNVPYKRLILGPWVHLQGSTASSLPADGLPDLKTLQLAWAEHYLKGIDTGIDRGPQVYQYELKGTDASHFVPSADYPIKLWAPSTLYLSGDSSGSAPTALHDGSLSLTPPAAAGSDTLPYVPTGTGCTRTTFQWGDASTSQAGIHAFPCETDERPSEVQKLTYSSPVIKDPVTIDGPINVHLVAESPLQRNITFTVNLTDVAPDGTSTQLSAGWLLATMRAESQMTAAEPVTLTVDGKLLRVFHPFTQQSAMPLDASPTNYNIEVFPTFATFQAGHRIRLDVGTGDTPHSAPSAPNLAASAGSYFLIDHNPANPSYMTLPTMTSGVLATTSFVAPRASGPVTATGAGLPPTSTGVSPAQWVTGLGLLLLSAFIALLMLGGPGRRSRD